MKIVVSSVRRAVGPLAALAAAAAAAHPGHDSGHAFAFLEGLAHLLTQPDHVAWLVLAVAGGVVGARAWRARRAARRAEPSRRR